MSKKTKMYGFTRKTNKQSKGGINNNKIERMRIVRFKYSNFGAFSDINLGLLIEGYI